VAACVDRVQATAVGGHLNVAGAFEAASLGNIVAAGNAAIPPEPAPTNGPPAAQALTPARTRSQNIIKKKHKRKRHHRKGKRRRRRRMMRVREK
jgi:hypothetical protein